jgi:hypothetical protein
MPITHTLTERLKVEYKDLRESKRQSAGYYFCVAVPTCPLDAKSPLDPVAPGAAYRRAAVYAAEHLARWRVADLNGESNAARAAFRAACTPCTPEAACPS